MSLVVSLRTVLCLRGRYLSTNSFMAQEIPSDVLFLKADTLDYFARVKSDPASVPFESRILSASIEAH